MDAKSDKRPFKGIRKENKMFLHYYVDTKSQAHGKHMVHHEGCSQMPHMGHHQYLGMFEGAKQAVAMARLVYAKATSCPHCVKIHIKHAVRIR